MGLGEYNANTGGVRQMGMGGVGLAAPNSVNVNELNPALLYYTGRTTFEAGYTGQYKTVKNATASSRSGNGTLGYLALAVPLSTQWGAAVGLKPLSAVDYESNIVQDVAGDARRAPRSCSSSTRARAAFRKPIWPRAFASPKAFTLGFTASYVFGVVDETAGTTVQMPTAPIRWRKRWTGTHTRYSDFAFRAGAHYRQKLGKDLNLNLGGVYSFAPQPARAANQHPGAAKTPTGPSSARATTVSDGRGSTFVPALAQVGVSFDNDKNWSLNLDVAQQQWSKFRSFGAHGPGPEQHPALGAGRRDYARPGLGGALLPAGGLPGRHQRWRSCPTSRAAKRSTTGR